MNCTHPKFVASLVEICRKALPPWKSALAELHQNCRSVLCTMNPPWTHEQVASGVVVYPNSGEVWNGITHTWETGTATADNQRLV